MTDEPNGQQPGDDDARDDKGEDLTGLKTALQKERERARALEKQAKAYEGLGLSPDEIADLKAKHEKAEEERAKAAGEWDTLREKLSSQHKSELEKLQEQLNAISMSEHEARVESGLKSALMEAGVTEEGASILPDILKTRAKIETVDGKRVVKVLDTDGTPMIGKDGRDASLSDLVAQVTEKYPSLFKAQTKPGSGTPPGGNGAGRANSQTVSASQLEGMTPQQKAAYFKANPNVQVSVT
jgi:hypothetical protein